MATDFQALLRRIVAGDIPREQRRFGEPTITGRPPSFPGQGTSPGFIPSMLIPDAFTQGANLTGQGFQPAFSPPGFEDEGGSSGGTDNDSFGGLGPANPSGRGPGFDAFGNELSGPPEEHLGPGVRDVDITSANLGNLAFNALSPFGLGAINSLSGKFGGPTIGDMFGNNSLFGFEIDTRGLDNMNTAFDFGLGRHVDMNSPEVLDEFGFGLQGLIDAINDPFGTETGFGDIDNETDAATGPGSVGGVGDDEAASTSGPGDPADVDDVGASDEAASGNASEADEDDESGGCIISTALLAGGDWDRKTKMKAVRWCRDNHHDGSVRGEIWVDGYHCWGAKFVKLMKRYPWFKRFGLKISTAYLNQITKEKVSVLGFLTWAWVTPLSYVVGAVRRL